MMPEVIPDAAMSYGNQGTCEAVAFFTHFGYSASPNYTLALCIYYLQVIRYNRSDRDFAKRIEPWLHGISIAFPLLGAIVNLAVGNFNSNGLVCWINPEPLYCAIMPEVVGECVRGANAEAYKLIFVNIPLFVAFVGIVYIMVVISWTVIKQERRNARFQFQFQVTTDGNPSTCHSFFRYLRSRIGNLFCRGPRESGDSNNIQVPTSTGTTYATRGEMASQNRVRQAVTQSLLYIAAFIITYVIWLVVTILEATNINPPFPLLVVYVSLGPLAGFFNILVYTRPKVATVRRRRPEYWWFRAFWMVVKAGGDMPDLPRRKQTGNIALANQNHTDINAMRRRLATPAPAQTVSSCTKDNVKVINNSSEPLNAATLPDRQVDFHAEDDVVSQLELALVRTEEEELNVDEGPATTDKSLTQQESANDPPDGDNLKESNSSCDAVDEDLP